MMRILLQWILSALSLMMVAKLLPGFHIKGFGSALGVAAVYGIFHVVLYPVLLFVAFIPVLLSFGLFIFVINAFLLFLTSALLDNFQIDNIPTALVGAVSLTILNGTHWRRSASWRYSGRKSWPHSLMQCASSMASRLTFQRCKSDRKPESISRSGAA